MIQEQINRQIAILSGLYTQSGAYKEKQEYKQLEKEEARVEEAMGAPTKQEEAEQISKDYAERAKSIAQRKYELRPTRENYKSYMAAAEAVDPFTTAQKANNNAAKKIDMKNQQKEKSKKYMDEVTKEQEKKDKEQEKKDKEKKDKGDEK